MAFYILTLKHLYMYLIHCNSVYPIILIHMFYPTLSSSFHNMYYLFCYIYILKSICFFVSMYLCTLMMKHVCWTYWYKILMFVNHVFDKTYVYNVFQWSNDIDRGIVLIAVYIHFTDLINPLPNVFKSQEWASYKWMSIMMSTSS